MNYRFLTTRHLLLAKILSFFAALRPTNAPPLEPIQGYTFLRNTEARNFRHDSRVGVYKNRLHKKFFIKQYSFTHQNVDALYLQNEIATLSNLQKPFYFNKYDTTVKFPKFVTSMRSHKSISIITEFVEGKRVNVLPSKYILKHIETAVAYLNYLSTTVPENTQRKFGVRSNALMVVTFPIHALRAYIRNKDIRKDIRESIRIFFLYVKYLRIKYPFAFVHRDMHPDNMLYDKKNKTLYLLDPECLVRADSLYDLALIPRLYARFLTPQEITQIIRTIARNEIEIKRIIPMMISACIVKIATEFTSDNDYQDAITGLHNVLTIIIPALTQRTI